MSNETFVADRSRFQQWWPGPFKWQAVGAGTAFVGTAGWSLTSALAPSEVDIVLRAFEEGRGWDACNGVGSTVIDRPDVVRDLVSLLRPKHFWHYAVVVGEYGSGKTVAIKQALSALDGVKGAVYFNCPSPANFFSANLLEVLGYRGDLNRHTDVLDRLLETLLVNAAAKFKSKHGRPMVLVVDSMDRLAETDPDALERWQGLAKDCLNNRSLRIVFCVANNDVALPQMMSQSTWRLAGSPYEVGEIPDDQAVEYLIKKGVSEDEARLAVALLTGGLINELQQFASASRRGLTCSQLVEIRDRRLRGSLMDSNVDHHHPLFKQLVSRTNVTTYEPLEMGMTKAQLALLVKNKILAMHVHSYKFYVYTFRDRHVAAWFRRTLGEDKGARKKTTSWFSGW